MKFVRQTGYRRLKVTYEIILIDDGSSDQSWNVIKQLKLKNPDIVGVKLRKNFGQHNALLCGVNLADANYIATIDDDLEQNPDDIDQLKTLDNRAITRFAAIV